MNFLTVSSVGEFVQQRRVFEHVYTHVGAFNVLRYENPRLKIARTNRVQDFQQLEGLFDEMQGHAESGNIPFEYAVEMQPIKQPGRAR